MSARDLHSAVVAAATSKLSTSKQLAERLGRSTATLARWRMLGTGPDFVRPHGVIYYEESAIQAWLDKNRHRSTAEYDPPQSGNHLGRGGAGA